jgi:hypothetical protein
MGSRYSPREVPAGMSERKPIRVGVSPASTMVGWDVPGGLTTMYSSRTFVIGTDGCGFFARESALRTEQLARLVEDVMLITQYRR